ncbi:MAG: DEAD/DEAH box helicase [Nanoarchaeota archaeon]|nr:DEAD/DEAH box helicase [Nanoarchaeota archaeon]
MKFEDFNLNKELLQSLKELGFQEPTEIQEKSIPPILEGKDVMGESATGSGKTLAFGVGIIKQVIPKQGLQALIVTPTRELAEQVKDSLRIFSKKNNLNIISIYGGVSLDKQVLKLIKAEVVISTPGRTLDHLRRRTINLSKVKLLVLDEADRMLDMGFIDDVGQIISQCPKKRQTLLFSATLSSKIQKLADRYMYNPIRVSAEAMVDPTKLTQVYYDIDRGLKLSLLIHLLQNEKSGLVMVFCNTKRNVDFLVKNLKSNRIEAIAIHGGLTQNKRTKTMELFNNAKFDVLVCTDVASRGLHIDNVSHIYNYDIPRDPKDYVHRIGRTARAGKSGKTINILCQQDYDNFSNVRQEYKEFKIEKEDCPYLKRVMAIRTESVRPQRGRSQYPQKRRLPNQQNRRRYSRN